MNHSPPTARVVADSSAPARRSHNVLLALSVTLFSSVGLSAARAAIRAMVHLRIRDPDVDFRTDALIRLADKARWVLDIGSLLLLVGIAVCLILLARQIWLARGKREPTPVLSLVIVAAVFACLDLVSDGGTTILVHSGHAEWLSSLYSKRMPSFGLTLISIAAPATLLWALGAYVGVATERTRRVAWVGGISIAWITAISIYGMINVVESPWWSLVLRSLPWLAVFAASGFLAWEGRRSVGPLPVAESRADVRMRWLSASSHLGVYGTALLWRLVVCISAYGLLYIAIESQSFSLVKLIGWALPLVTAVLGAVMLYGVVGFANQPRSSQGRAPAYGAAFMMAIGTCIDLFLFIAIIRMLSKPPGDLGAASSRLDMQLETLQAIAPWSLILGFASLMLLLISFRAVARRFEQPELVARCATVLGLVVGGSVVAIGLRLWIAGKDRLSQNEALAVVVLILVVVAAAIATYLRLLHGLQEAINRKALALDDGQPY